MVHQGQSPRVILGIESSCDDTAAAVLRIGDRVEVLSSIVRGQDAAHAPYGGVVPEIAARAHADVIDHVTVEALDRAGVALSDVDLIAATAGPGLIGGVMAGFTFAKGLSLAAGVPLVPVNHLEGHARSAGLEAEIDGEALLLLVSGGHSQLLLLKGPGEAKRLGTTIDDAAGEAFDKTAKLLGLGAPGGPAIERLAAQGDGLRFKMPRPLLGREGFDFSFSGLKTAVRQTAERAAPLSEQDRADLCASFQKAAVDHLAQRTSAALEATGAKTLIAAGGVASNKILRGCLEETALSLGARFVAPSLHYCTDNAAMIGYAGYLLDQAGKAPSQHDALALPPRPRWPLDQQSAPVLGKGRRGVKV
ncbi:MAG: tRNA (adenosine(37)-N6)-threonylcarbamoyltransferase complex transferase subunit TsaD [Pseudomonadota bacterium]